MVESGLIFTRVENYHSFGKVYQCYVEKVLDLDFEVVRG